MYIRSAGLQGTETRNQICEIDRPSGLETQILLGCRVLEAQKIRMQGLARKFPDGREGSFLLR